MSIDFNRPIAKAIAATNIAGEVVYWIAHFHASQDAGGKSTEPSDELIAAYGQIKPNIAEVILKHLDAYDQSL